MYVLEDKVKIETNTGSKIKIKVLCYLQSGKIWVFVLQNQCIFAKSYHSHWVAGRTNILCWCIIYIYFQFPKFLAFAVLFMCYFRKLQLLVVKNWNKFFYIVLLFVWAQKVCLRFLKSYFKLETLILLFFAVSF